MKTVKSGFSIAMLALAVFISNNLHAEQDVWQDKTNAQIAHIGERIAPVERYRSLALDLPALAGSLQNAPMERSGQYGVEISLPMPDGSFAQFVVQESPIMEQGLADQFPNIKTYTGSGLSDPSASLRLSLTDLGLHAQILSVHGSVYIDPLQKGDTRHYISYAKRDYQRIIPSSWVCEVEGESAQDKLFVKPTSLNKISNGATLRTYRTAIAATGEYTANFGGTVNGAMAAIVVSLNRVNGVYEKDFAVRMVLIANNNLVVYTDGATDPYTNGSGTAMLGENTTNLNAVIGSANYDVGHVFSTGGGGVATLNGPCSSSKARGVTGSSNPVGDPFDIDYVAHEIGHQFGGRHTFNGSSGNCSGGNRNASTAYEPGSGTTIMAYAGICSPQNIQPNSDDHFHAVSLHEIITFVTGATGNSCPIGTATGNTPPVADAGPATVPVYTIPKSTPFELLGSGTDANGSDVLSYNWEQYDVGATGAPNQPVGNAPLFRSFPSKPTAARTFPQLSNLLSNTQTMGELLPDYQRNMVFRLTVRDNRAGGGGVDQDSIALAVDGTAGPFLVTDPNTAVTWQGGTTQTVTWDVAGTAIAPVSCANVDILYSSNGGNTFATTLLATTPNDGSQAVTIPPAPNNTARIKVKCSDNIFFDISNVNFIVSQPALPFASTSPAALSFSANVTQTQMQSTTLSNQGGGTLTIASMVIPAPQFVRTGGTCVVGTNLANGQSCTIQVTFTAPATAGNTISDLTINSNASPVAHVISLNGTAVGVAQLSVQSASMNFSAIVGETHDLSTTISNTGTASLTINSLATAAPFSIISGGTCSVGGAIAPAGSCTVTLRFTAPVSVGISNGTLQVNSSGGNGSVNLVGNAQPDPNKIFENGFEL